MKIKYPFPCHPGDFTCNYLLLYKSYALADDILGAAMEKNNPVVIGEY